MRKSRLTQGQIVAALRQAESGIPVAEICRKLGVTETTFYRWIETIRPPKPPPIPDATKGMHLSSAAQKAPASSAVKNITLRPDRAFDARSEPAIFSELRSAWQYARL